MSLDFSKTRVLIVGDVMLDSYWQGSTDRISPEAPVPVVHVNDISWRVGGSGNVAVNVTSLGGKASLLAVVGDDHDGKRLQDLLEQSAIENYCLVVPGQPTTNKLRVLSQHQQLIRLDFERVIESLELQPLLYRFEKLLDVADVVILSDYGKGLLENIRPFIERACEVNVPVLIDPKKKKFSEYAGAYLLTPNIKEMETVVGKWKNQAELEEKAHQIINEINLQGLLITQGGQGMTLVMKGHHSRHFPAHAQDVYDVTGAGDTVIATLATGLASGMTVQDSVLLSCKAAGIVVGRVGTSSITVQDLESLERSSSSKLSPVDSKLLDREQLKKQLEQYKKQGKKIVMTNGCFDLLHSGHVRYLEQAAAIGDVLIVAVNSDASVARLKGSGRPVNTAYDRMTLLAGLASVDQVIEFNEDTPEQLICFLRPDILVKGGDYKKDEIAGRDCVKEVVIIDFVAGKSTTAMLSKIRQMDN